MKTTTPAVRVRPTVHIRWMIRRDLPEVLAIEEEAFLHPWDEATFIQHMCTRNCIGMVAEDGEHVTGFMVYELDKLLDGIAHELTAAQSWLEAARRDGPAATHALEQLAEHAEHARHTALTAVLLIRGKWPMESQTKAEG